MLDAGIVDEDIDRAKFGQCLAHHRLDWRLLRKFGVVVADRPAMFGRQLGAGLLAFGGFADAGEELTALADMKRRWPNATYVEDSAGTTALAQRVFDTNLWRADQPLRVVLIGTDFEVRVWETLLKIPMGQATTYSSIAANVNSPKASRAVGAAVGKNPVSFVVPCHRVIGKSGALTGYHWGITRKQAMLDWEAGQVGVEQSLSASAGIGSGDP